MTRTTLQISLAPSDHRLAQHMLPHQIQAWEGQVDEILLTVDLHRSEGRFSDDWEKGRESLAETIRKLPSSIRTFEVNYSKSGRSRVEDEWTGGRKIPSKDFRGGPSYSYFFGLTEARGQYVIHSDADIFYGGGSQSWIHEAIDLYQKNSDILFIGPLSGPPNSELTQNSLPCIPDPRAIGGHSYDFMSTRFFMIDRQRFKERVVNFVPTKPSTRSIIKALLEGNPAWDLPEHWMTQSMLDAGMCRFEFLGVGDGMWAVHPPYRCADFFVKLPELIKIVESGDIPDAQKGVHDFNESLVDWSEAKTLLKKNRWWRRLLKIH